MIKILVVDDETAIRKQLEMGLKAYGYHVITAANGEEALKIAAQQPPTIVILDIALGAPPDGLEVCRRLRESSAVPIIMLSVRDDKQTIINALHVGADDYLTKPFSTGELEARIDAVLRRASADPGRKLVSEIRIGELVLDLANRRVMVRGEDVHLTPKEYELLRLLATHPGKVMTHNVLLSQVWGAEYAGMDHYVRVFINQIRKKLKEDPENNVRYILNEPGVGYRFIDVK